MLAIDFARQLTRSHKLSDATFETALKRLGDQGVIDLIAAIGYYAMLAVCHVALEVRPKKAILNPGHSIPQMIEDAIPGRQPVCGQTGNR